MGKSLLPIATGAPCRTTHYACPCMLERLAALEADTATLRAQLAQAEQAHADFVTGTHEMLGELLTEHQITPESCPGGPCIANALLAIGQALAAERTQREQVEQSLRATAAACAEAEQRVARYEHLAEVAARYVQMERQRVADIAANRPLSFTAIADLEMMGELLAAVDALTAPTEAEL